MVAAEPSFQLPTGTDFKALRGEILCHARRFRNKQNIRFPSSSGKHSTERRFQTALRKWLPSGLLRPSSHHSTGWMPGRHLQGLTKKLLHRPFVRKLPEDASAKTPTKQRDPGGRKATKEALSHSCVAGLVTGCLTRLDGAGERKVESAQEKNESQ